MFTFANSRQVKGYDLNPLSLIFLHWLNLIWTITFYIWDWRYSNDKNLPNEWSGAGASWGTVEVEDMHSTTQVVQVEPLIASSSDLTLHMENVTQGRAF